MGLFSKRPDAKEVKVNWLQDIGPIYPNDDYMPHVLIHNPKTKKDGEYIFLFCDNKQEAIAIIDHIIELNGGKDKFFKHEIEGWSHVFSGHLFDISYLNKLMGNHVIVELNRREEREFVSYGNDKSEIFYGIHKDSKKINSIIKGLNSIVYNSGEMTSGGGHLYFDTSGSHIVSYWDDIENAIEQFKSIVDSYPKNAISKDLFIETEIKNFSYKNLLEIINNEGFLIEFKTNDFKINLSQGNSSFQINIYLNEIIIEDKQSKERPDSGDDKEKVKKDIHKKNIEETPPPILKFNNETIKAAVKDWLADESIAEAKYGHISNWDTTEVTDMNKLFLDAHTFNEPLNNWDVSKVTNMHAMFDNAYVFNQPLNNWDVSKVTNMSEMFSSAENLAFNQPLDNWDVSNVIDMTAMFDNAHVFNQPIGNWDVSSVTDMSNMFYGATAFNQPIENWDVSKVTDMAMMFCRATAFNQPIGNWDVSSVTVMISMFGGAEAFNQPIGDWDVSSVTDMEKMFTKATDFNQPIGNWDVSKVNNMHNMFNTATAFNQPIGNWDVSNVINMYSMFCRATAFNQPIGNWDVSSVTVMISMFGAAEAFNQPIGDWDVINVANFEGFSEYAPLSETNKPNFIQS